MSGTLYVVATPIGNLEDITLRALRVLREAHVIAAEDTRRTARLLNHHAIPTKTISFHAHNTRSRVPQLIRRLQAGASVAVVSDAGTPGVSDPGSSWSKPPFPAELPSSPSLEPARPLPRLVACGFPVVPFTVFGFPPRRSNDRIKWLELASSTEHVFSFFESPHRIHHTLREAAPYFGIRPIVVARELTKVHQEFIRGTASEVIERLHDAKGEFTLVVGPATNARQNNHLLSSDDAVIREFCRLTESGAASRREAVRLVARGSGRSSKDVYSAIERAKKLV